MVAGGGLKMGQAIGASTARGERPKDRPYTVPQVLSTIYRAIGIDPAMTFPNGTGRPMYILDDREPVTRIAVSAISRALRSETLGRQLDLTGTGKLPVLRPTADGR